MRLFFASRKPKRQFSRLIAATLLCGSAYLRASAQSSPAASDSVLLQAGKRFTLRFPGLPPTFADNWKRRQQLRGAGGATVSPAPDLKHPPQMTVFLPKNYDPKDAGRKYPLLLFLGGGDGGTGGDPFVARKLSEENGFVCVNVPLFKTDYSDYILRDADSSYAWPFYQTMLHALEAAVPNLDHDRYVLGGFSNGAHMTQGLIDTTNGQAVRRFSAFFLVEGGGNIAHWERLKNKPVLLLYGIGGGRNADAMNARYRQTQERAAGAGVTVALHAMPGVGHGFPKSAYPAVRAWLQTVTGR